MKDYDKLPMSEVCNNAMKLWIEEGRIPGGFLTAVLCNDLKEACFRADDNNRRLLFEIVVWLYNEAPTGCWGSAEKVDDWHTTLQLRREERENG